MTATSIPAPIKTRSGASYDHAFQLFIEAFGRPRDPRSPAYQAGAGSTCSPSFGLLGNRG